MTQDEIPQGQIDIFNDYAEKHVPDFSKAGLPKEFRESIKLVMVNCMKNGYINGYEARDHKYKINQLS